MIDAALHLAGTLLTLNWTFTMAPLILRLLRRTRRM
jgi:hypothetical protein